MLNNVSGKTDRLLVRKLKQIAIAFLLAVFLAGLLFFPAVAELLHIKTNMSSRPNETSGFPAIVINPTDPGNPAYGEYVAVAWSDGLDPASADQGRVRLKFTTESSGIWREKEIIGASGTDKSQDVAMASDPVTDNRVHLVWAHTSDGVLFDAIYYVACTLDVSGGTATCDTPSDSNAPEAGSFFNLEAPDVAVDNSGQPHVVWTRRLSQSNIEIRYGHKSGGTWARQTLASGSKHLQPAIVHSTVDATEYLHLVWVDQDQTDPAKNRVHYRRRVKTGGAWGSWEAEQILFNANNPGVLYTEPGLPDIAAVGSDVYVVWDVIPKGGSVGQFVLHYNHSPDSGDSWDDNKCIPSDAFASDPQGCPAGEVRPSGHKDDQLNDEFNDRLRPQLFLEITATLTIPHLLWHQTVEVPAGEGLVGRQDVVYTRLSSGAWMSPTNVISDAKSFAIKATAPMMVVGQDGEQQFVYMEQTAAGPNQPWDVYYYGDDIPAAQIYLPVINKTS